MINGRPESLESQHSRWFGNPTADTTDIRAALLHALDHNTFVLLAQPIVSTRGEEPYHEILIRMHNGNLFPLTTFCRSLATRG
mgnify:CR=1 FL=1